MAQQAPGAVSARDSAAAHAYLDGVLDLIERRSVARDSVDWRVIRPAAHARVAAGGSTAAAYPAIRWVLGQLGDRHSRLLTPDEAAALQRGLSRGFGLRSLYPEGIVALVYAGGPADRAGVRVGDVITAVNGGRVRTDPLGVLVALPPDGSVRLALRRSDGTRRDVVLAASLVEMNRVPWARRVEGGIGYVELPELVGSDWFGDSASYAVAGQAAIRSADAPPGCGWIVDLRRNGGGNMWPMLAAAGPLLGDGLLGGFISPGTASRWSYDGGRARMDGRTLAEVRDPYAIPAEVPVAVLTSRLTASSGEAVVIAFRGRPGTRSFGEATRGLPTANATLPLPDGAMLFLTTAVDADRTGRAYRTRIEPDERAPTEWRDLGGDDDPAIAAAVRWLRGARSCAEPAR